MEPARRVAELHSAVAQALADDLDKGLGSRNTLGLLHNCRAMLATSEESATRVASAASRQGAEEGAASPERGVHETDLRQRLDLALRAEEETTRELEAGESAHVARRLALEDELHRALRAQEERLKAVHLSSSSWIVDREREIERERACRAALCARA